MAAGRSALTTWTTDRLLTVGGVAKDSCSPLFVEIAVPEDIKLEGKGFPPAAQRTKDTVDRFLGIGQDSFENALANLKELPKRDRPDWVVRNIDYSQHAIGAVKWLRSMNATRKTE